MTGLSLLQISSLSDAEIAAVMRYARWEETGGEPICPKCKCDSIYCYRTRHVWQCKACKHQFTITSGTSLASRKMSARELLLAMALFVSGAKGISSLQMSRMLGAQYKTCFVFAHKIREAILAEQNSLPPLQGNVEIDGAVFGGYTERYSYVDKRTGKIHCRRRYGQRRVVVVARERGGRTITRVVDKEADAVPFLADRISGNCTIHADLAAGWDSLHDLFNMLRVNHSVAFKECGACTNHAESFWALLRRKQVGIHHRMSGDNLALYAAEMAWRNDFKRLSADQLVTKLLSMLLSSPPSTGHTGYWQGGPNSLMKGLKAAGLM